MTVFETCYGACEKDKQNFSQNFFDSEPRNLLLYYFRRFQPKNFRNHKYAKIYKNIVFTQYETIKEFSVHEKGPLKFNF